MAQKEVLPTTLRIRLGNVVKNILVLLISLILVLGICEIILRVYNPLGFRIKGDKIILPINKKEIIYHEHGFRQTGPGGGSSTQFPGFPGA